MEKNKGLCGDVFELFEQFDMDIEIYGFVPSKEFDGISYDQYWSISGEA